MEGWKRELSSGRPEAAGMLNGKTAIVRRSIERYEREGPDGGTESGYECECRTVPAAELVAGMGIEGGANQLIGMEAQADLYEALLEERDNQMTIMCAIADLYEAVAAGKGA